MKPAGVILIIVIIGLIIKYQNIQVLYAHLLGITIAVELFINVGYFVMLGTNEIMYSDVLIGLTSLLSFALKRKSNHGQSPKRNALTIKALVFIITITFSCMLLIVAPFKSESDVILSVFILNQSDINSAIAFNGSTILRFIRFVLFVICGTGIVKCNDGRPDLIRICIRYVYSFGVFIFVYLCFEFITKSILKSTLSYDLIAAFFGQGGSTLSYLLTRGGVYALQGLTREPIYLSTGLFSASIIVFLSDFERRQKTIFIICSAIFILVSGSFSGILFGLMLFIIVNSGKKKLSFRIITILGIVIVSILFVIDNTRIPYISYIAKRLSNFLSFLSKDFVLNNSTSDQTRLKGIIEAIYLWLQRPLFGVGLGTFDTYAAIPSILCNIGIIGTIAWCSFVKAMLGNSLIDKSTTVLLCLSIAFTFSGSIGIMYSVSILFILYLLRDERTQASKRSVKAFI